MHLVLRLRHARDVLANDVNSPVSVESSISFKQLGELLLVRVLGAHALLRKNPRLENTRCTF